MGCRDCDSKAGARTLPRNSLKNPYLKSFDAQVDASSPGVLQDGHERTHQLESGCRGSRPEREYAVNETATRKASLPQKISDVRDRVGRTADISERTWNFWFKTRGHHFAHLDIIRISNLYERALALAKE